MNKKKAARKQEAAVVTIEDKAAKDFQFLLPRFKEKVGELSKNGMLRVFKALVEWPFHEGQVVLAFPDERVVFNIGMQLMDCKFVMLRAGYEMHQDVFKQMLEKMSKGEANDGTKEVKVEQDCGSSEQKVGDGNLHQGEKECGSDRGTDSERV